MKPAPVFLLLAVTGVVGAPAAAGVSYSALRDGVWQIFHQRSPQSEPRAVLPGPDVDAISPAASADGRVAFEVPGLGIMVCPLDGGRGCREIKTDAGSAVRPAWRAKTGELVFVRYLADAGGEDSEILITREGLEEIGPLVSHTGIQDDPDVSPDGRWLVYSSAQTVSLARAGVQVVRHLWLMDLATGVARPLIAGAHQDVHPDWSPDGERIAFASDRSGQFEIWTMSSAGTGLTKLTSGPGSKTWPAWSPDGDSLMYVRAHEGRETLWITPVGGAEARPFEPFGPGADVQLRDPDWR